MNLNEFYNLYHALETRGLSPWVYPPVVDGNNPLGIDSQDIDNYSTSRGVRTWRILAQVITYDFCFF